jgi:hypothetical protein
MRKNPEPDREKKVQDFSVSQENLSSARKLNIKVIVCLTESILGEVH